VSEETLKAHGWMCSYRATATESRTRILFYFPPVVHEKIKELGVERYDWKRFMNGQYKLVPSNAGARIFFQKQNHYVAFYPPMEVSEKTGFFGRSKCKMSMDTATGEITVEPPSEKDRNPIIQRSYRGKKARKVMAEVIPAGEVVQLKQVGSTEFVVTGKAEQQDALLMMEIDGDTRKAWILPPHAQETMNKLFKKYELEI